MTLLELRARTDVRIIAVVRAFRAAALRGPSLREIVLEVGATTKSSISRAVSRLVAAGRLVRLADGLDVPDDIEAAATLLRRRGWHVGEPQP